MEKTDLERLREKIKKFEDFDAASTDGLIAGDTRQIGRRSEDLEPDVITHFDHDLVAIFQQEAKTMPITLEIGFGKGRSLLDYAETHPDRLVVGVEVRRTLCNHLMRRVLKRKKTNIRVVLGDCRYLLPILFPEPGIDEVFLLFPDPWWKKRHAKRRYGVKFFKMLAGRMKPGALLVIKSDVNEYLKHLIRAVNESGAFESGAVPEDMAWTNREHRLRDNDLPVFEAAFRLKQGTEA